MEPCGVELSTVAEACAGVVSARGPVLSTETTAPLEGSRHLGDSGEPAQAPSAASGMADRQEVFRSGEGRASGVEDFMAAVGSTEAVADFTVGAVGNRRFVMSPVARGLQKRRDAICGERS